MSFVKRDVERIRQEGVAEGILYDCSEKLHAARVVRDGGEYCEGFRLGIDRRGLSICCVDCKHYVDRKMW